jgi:hypothetical protein
MEDAISKSETIVVRDWDPDIFHRRVVELEANGYSVCLDSYQIVPEMNPDTGEVIHLRSVEMRKPANNAGR